LVGRIVPNPILYDFRIRNEDAESNLADKLVLQRIYELVTIVLFIIGIYYEYEIAFNPPAPNQVNEALVVVVFIVFGLYAVHEYFHL
jgi:hypothetical protein